MGILDADRIGIDVDDLRLGTRQGMKQASAMEFRTVELGAARGEAAPGELTGSGRRELKRLAQGLGLELASLSADMPELRLTDPARAEERIERTCRIIDLARDLQTPIVTTGLGVVIDSRTGEPSDLVIEALGRIGEHADSRGIHLALRPSLDGGKAWAAFLKAIRCPSIRVCLDPAALVMTGANPMASFEQYVEHVALFHARDATAGFSDPQGGEPRLGCETALGDGDVDLVGVLDVLREADYHGACVVRRYNATNPRAELIAARETLRRMG